MILIDNAKAVFGLHDANTLMVKGADMINFPSLENVVVLIENDRFTYIGPKNQLPENVLQNAQIIDAHGGFILPGFCDPHTHIVFSGWRETEFRDKILGLSYEEIAKKGGGILQSAQRLADTSEDSLFEQSMARVRQMTSMGTTAIEIKSGYGLSVKDELKMLRVIRRIQQNTPHHIKSTFLGAHAVPLAYKQNPDAYVDLIINEMLPNIAAENLADYIDVFCDRGFFTVQQTDRMLDAGAKYGLKPKIHANELDYSGGIQVGVKHAAISVDHLECTGDEEIETLLDSNTVPTLLPSTAFFLGLHYPPARKMIESGLGIAMASDYNPGSSPSGSIPFVISLACIKMKLLPEEAFNAVTLNSAAAMEWNHSAGSITIGKQADFIITNPMNSISFIPYTFSTNHIHSVYIKGKKVH